MVVFQELSMVSMKTCDEFGQHFVCRVEHLASSCCNVHLDFERYDTEQSLKKRTRVYRYGSVTDAYHMDLNDKLKSLLRSCSAAVILRTN